ncbi:hypothetical protein EVAR_70461_1 [Eumeta japonica]|uniref:Uncharacterized protein n=1 Tax=Eumeta variegata TaxID=151549 RepID=A0A4C2AGC3_EUMVA|nr:hypothetical protein EVAR_70461_1 [Eumeta japonica]
MIRGASNKRSSPVVVGRKNPFFLSGSSGAGEASDTGCLCLNKNLLQKVPPKVLRCCSMVFNLAKNKRTGGPSESRQSTSPINTGNQPHRSHPRALPTSRNRISDGKGREVMEERGVMSGEVKSSTGEISKLIITNPTLQYPPKRQHYPTPPDFDSITLSKAVKLIHGHDRENEESSYKLLVEYGSNEVFEELRTSNVMTAMKPPQTTPTETRSHWLHSREDVRRYDTGRCKIGTRKIETTRRDLLENIREMLYASSTKPFSR